MQKSGCMSGYYCGGKVSWSLKVTEQATLGTKLEWQSWFRKIPISLVFTGNESAARVNL